MAKKRMFSLDVVDTDKFLDTPITAQALYFHLGMRADDDGFVSSPKKICAMIGSRADDLKVLISKGYLIPFESGVVVISDWNINNYIQKDRYTPTRHQKEKAQLNETNSVYSLPMYTECTQDVSNLDTQIRLDKNSIDKNNKEGKKTTRFISPTLEEVTEYCNEKGYAISPQQFIDFYESKGWMVGKNKMKDWKAAVRTWGNRQQSGSSCTSATNNRFNNFHQRKNNMKDEELERLFTDNNRKE